MSDSESSTSSQESMGPDPRTSKRRYAYVFKKIVCKYFPSQQKRKSGEALPGENHDMFISNLKRIIETSGITIPAEGKTGDDKESDNFFAVCAHIICNQFVRAAGEPTAPWEEDESMKDFYGSGALNHWKGKNITPPSPKEVPTNLLDQKTSDKLMDDMDDVDISDEEDNNDNIKDPEGITVMSILNEMNIEKLTDVAKKAESVTYRLWTNIQKSAVPESKSHLQTYKTYIYPNTEATKVFIKGAVKTAIMKLAQAAQKRGRDGLISDEFADRPVKTQRVQEPPKEITIGQSVAVPQSAPAAGGNVMGYLDSVMGGPPKNDDPDAQVFWGDVIQEVGVSEAYLPNDNIEEMEKNVKMSCGSTYVRAHPNNPAKDFLTGRRTYKQEHRNDMLIVAKSIKAALMKRKAQS